jgi:hypothetical protein
MRRIRIAELATVAGLVGALALPGCDGRQSLVGTDADGAMRETSPVLAADSIVREGVVLSVGVRGFERGNPVHVTVLVLDDARNVLWRSAPVVTDSSSAAVALHGLPADLVGRTWLVTAFAERNGRRAYAGSDTAGAVTLATATTRRVSVFGGTSVGLGGRVRALVADGRLGRAFYAVEGSGEVGVLDLAGRRADVPLVRDRGEVWDLDVAGNTLAYLADAGSRVSFVDVAGLSAGEKVVGPLVVQRTRDAPNPSGPALVDTLVDVVRPYAMALRLACDDAGSVCARPVALVGSPTQAGGSVIRTVRPDSAREGLLVLGYTRLAGGPDTVPAAVTVSGPTRPGGESETVLARTHASGCASLHLGLLGFSASEAGELFSAGGESCGPAARIVRVDAYRGPTPTLAQLGVATMLAEDRIEAPVEVAAAADGSRLLVREADAVWLLDRDLRVLGFRSVSSRARIAWLRPGDEPGLQFMIADGASMQVFEADQFKLLDSVQVGPVSGAPLAFVLLPDGRRAAVFVAAERQESAVIVTLPAR